jgi:trigger factor
MADTEKNQDADSAEVAEKKRFESEAETVGPCKIEVKITIPAETVKEELDERFREIIRTVAFPGFRVGHAPRRLVEKKLGDEVHDQVKESLLSDSFKDAVQTHELDSIRDPDVDLEGIELHPERPIEYKAVFLVRPKVEIPEFGEISVEAARPEVTDEMVEEAITELRRRHSVLETAPDGKMAAGDVAIVDLLATVGDEKILDRENVEYHHPAPHVVALPVRTLAEEILGKATGDEFTLTEKLPDTWSVAEQAGQEMRVEVKLKDVKRYVLPELDDALAEELDFDSVEELREEVREGVERAAEQEARSITDQRIVDALISASPFDLPEEVVREEISLRIKRKEGILRMHCANEAEYEEKLAEAKGAERGEVEREFRSGFMLAAIAKQEKVFVTESEVEEQITRMAAGYNRSVEEMTEYLEQRDMIGSIRASMREAKVMEILRKKVMIEEEE